MIAGLIHAVWKFLWNAVVVQVCTGLLFIGYKANQPMSVAGAPNGMTYIEFIQDRLDAAKTATLLRYGRGMTSIFYHNLLEFIPVYTTRSALKR
jgi:hypothetical protein